MNGVISTSMRQKGMNYKLIFGVPIPEIKHIAASHEPDAELARALWKEDVREMKILATLLFPAGSMTQEEALAWMREIPYPEIAEQCCNNLFPTVEQPDQLALKFLADKKSPFGRMCGFLDASGCRGRSDRIFLARETGRGTGFKVLRSSFSCKCSGCFVGYRRRQTTGNRRIKGLLR